MPAIVAMSAFALLASAILYAGYPVARRFREIDHSTPLEIASYSAVFGLAMWLAVNWALALTHTLTRASLLAAAAVFVLFAFADAVRRLRISLRGALLILPVILWIAYVLWRGSVLPPDSHDVLAYHLPRATFIAEAHGYEPFWTGDQRTSDLPANYELLLADVLVLGRSDRLTEWIGTASFILFLIAGGAIAERWWGRGRHVAATMLAVAATPVVLLHSGADKNDLMTCWLAVVALLAGARWYARGGALPWVALIAALGVGGGTKPQQAAILLGLAPFLVVRAVRAGVRARDVALTAVLAIAVFALDGGAAYIFNALRHQGAPLTVQMGAEQRGASTIIQYGDWSNLWQFPYLLLTAPFGRADAVWVPWQHRWWFWPRYELFFSNFGVLLTLLVVALPFCVWRYRAQSSERFASSAAAAIAFFVILPVQFRPIGFFGEFPRYLAFIVPVVVAWTVAPFVRELAGRTARLVLLLLWLIFGVVAVDVAVHDRFSPLEYAVWAAEHPGTRVIWFRSLRAALIVDRFAGPRDTVAVDGGFDTWLYPAMGANRTRHLIFLTPGSPIPAQARWVMIDHSFAKVWGHPQLRDLGDYWTLAGKGTPTEADTRVLRALASDPAHWQLVFYSPAQNQAVFYRRITAAPAR